MAAEFKLLLVAVIIVTGLNALTWNKTWRFQGWRANTGDAHVIYSVGLTGCVLGCSQNKKCKAVTYDAEIRECKEVHKSKFKANESPNFTTVIVGNISLLVLGKVGSYEYTEAQDGCTHFQGGRLLTVAEITSLYEDGYGRCKCTWLEGGTMMSIIQEGANCSQPHGINNCSSSRADAWCTGTPFIV